MLHDALEITTGPIAIRWPKTPATMVTDDQVGHGLAARLVSADPDAKVCLVGIGNLLDATIEAAEILRAEGITTTVWDPRAVQPLDPHLIADALRHDVVVSVEDGIAEGGVGSRLSALVTAAAIDSGTGRPPYVIAMGAPREFIAHGRPDEILSGLGLDAAGIVAKVHTVLG